MTEPGEGQTPQYGVLAGTTSSAVLFLSSLEAGARFPASACMARGLVSAHPPPARLAHIVGLRQVLRVGRGCPYEARIRLPPMAQTCQLGLDIIAGMLPSVGEVLSGGQVLAGWAVRPTMTTTEVQAAMARLRGLGPRPLSLVHRRGEPFPATFALAPPIRGIGTNWKPDSVRPVRLT